MKQLTTLAFYAKYDGWHGYAKTAKPQIVSLVKKGFLEINEFNQARFTGKVFSNK